MTIKQVIIFAIALVIIHGCIKYKDNFFQEKNQHKTIALQPLEEYDTALLNFISTELSNFYNRKVIILNPLPIPPAFRLARDTEIYSADLILDMLSGFLNDEIIQVVGVTHKNIFLLKKNEHESPGRTRGKNVSVVLGLGDYPGNCSVVSDFLFRTNDPKLLRHRLRSVIIHEIGHNLGLDHCAFDKCIMSEENRKIPVLDNSGNDYCDRCKRKLDH